MRTQNTIKNIYISLASQIIIIILGFISRKIFINSLGTEYLGLNGLLTNILSMLSLVEGGMGASIVYNLYKPLAEDDRPTIIALTQLYKKIYGFLAIAVFVLGGLLYPFLEHLMKDQQSIPFLGIIYFIFIIKNVISYLNAHKWSLINADQKGYILASYNLIFNVFTTVMKIIILMLTSDYILYLLIELFIFIIQTIWNGYIVNKFYPYISSKEKYVVNTHIKANIFTNVKSIFLHKIGTYFVFGTDNLLISAYINTNTVGLYSNYTLILTNMQTLLNQVSLGIDASIGNLIATEGEEKTYKVYKIFYLINFWLYSMSTIFLYNIVEPFINVWFGEGLLLSHGTFIIILINFYLTGMRNPINIFKEKSGIFAPDRYMPLIEAIVNLIVSIILVKKMGIMGIFLGTTISTLVIPFWTQPKIVFEKVFGVSLFEYFKSYLYYIFIALSVGYFSSYVNNYIPYNGFLLVICRSIVSLVICNLCYFLIFFRTDEFKYLFNVGRILLKSKINLKVFG